MMSSSDEKYVKLISGDKNTFRITIAAARKSRAMERLIEDLNVEAMSEEAVIPLPKISANLLKKVIDFLQAHVNDTFTPLSYRIALHQNKISEFDKSYLVAEQSSLNELFQASVYLQSDHLTELIVFATTKSIEKKVGTESNELWTLHPSSHRP